ncbi:calcium-binding protein [Acuticoccus mangrovi]|uniref:Calcium-binding protein n=1 Tax=Acuticoccus mangrovi TaxID=2796142 RepID=A0A934IQ91_9HYPH|nr:calcium-binding protein [Acuticoccus mangrovi]MBJ3776720.1 hypothetical protein [Acuticoccus mangrovi]
MASGTNLREVTVTIENYFYGPDFVNGLAKQTNEYEIISDTKAVLKFQAGFHSDRTIVQVVTGEGFGYDANGRLTGIVTSYVGFYKDTPDERWTFTGLSTSLDRLNTLASDPDVKFSELLVIPLQYTYVGADREDFYIEGSFADSARGYGGDDFFNGLDGPDTLIGDGGHDTLIGDEGDDLLQGGAASDHLLGRSGSDIIEGGGGNDKIAAGGDSDFVDAGAGNDSVAGGTGDDLIIGGDGNDQLRGNQGSDTILGGDGVDWLRGDSDSDILDGGNGADSIRGGTGEDTILGGAGHDKLFGEDDDDDIDGGDGNDQITGGSGVNYLFGGAGDDTIVGGTDTDELYGGDDNDIIRASTGADLVNGGAGDDTLSGNDIGGGGDFAIDSFAFSGAFGNDVITDFELNFDQIIFTDGIEEDDISTTMDGNDAVITVDVDGDIQTLVVRNATTLFNPEIDILVA